MALQIHIADATGDAVVLSAGYDGELAITRKPSGNGYHISTNFNLANPGNGTKGWRYETATTMLEKLAASPDLKIGSAGEVLDSVHLENLTTNTLGQTIAGGSEARIAKFYYGI